MLMFSVFEMARNIRESATPPTVADAYDFGKELGDVQSVCKIALVTSLFLLVISLLILNNVIKGPTNGGWALLGFGSAGLIASVYFFGALHQAKQNSERHLTHKEEWCWNVFSLAERIANGGNDPNVVIPAHQNPSIVAECCRQYATLNMLNLALAATTTFWLALGIPYPPFFAGMGAQIIFSVWLARKLERTNTEISEKLQINVGPSLTYNLRVCWDEMRSGC